MTKGMEEHDDTPRERRSARRTLWSINALLSVGVVAYLSTITPQPDPAVAAPARPHYAAPTTQQQPRTPITPSITPQTDITPAAPQTVDQSPATNAAPSRDLRIPGYDAYNSLVPTIEQVALAEGVPADILALIILNESKGNGGTRHEPGFQAKYVVPVLNGSRDTKQKPLRLTLERMLAQQQTSGAVRNNEEFATKLATSYGPAQIMYLVAIEGGFRGSAEELADPATNITFTSKRIKAHAASTTMPDPASPAQRTYDWHKVLIDYNSGSVNGTPHPGYLERGTLYARKLGL